MTMLSQVEAAVRALTSLRPSWSVNQMDQELSDAQWVKTSERGVWSSWNVGECHFDVLNADDGTQQIESTVSVTAVSESLDPMGYDDLVDEYFAKFEQAVAATSKIVGKPSFNNGAAAPGFPQDQNAVWLAQWDAPGGRLMVQQRHEDKELPFRILIVLAP